MEDGGGRAGQGSAAALGKMLVLQTPRPGICAQDPVPVCALRPLAQTLCSWGWVRAWPGVRFRALIGQQVLRCRDQKPGA